MAERHDRLLSANDGHLDNGTYHSQEDVNAPVLQQAH
jgi:hypothetical protein